jgi:1A family penicillin-binding protein
MTNLKNRLFELFKAVDLRPVGLVGLFLVTGGIGVALGTWQNVCATCPSVAQIRTYETQETSKLLAHDGRLIVEIGTERRTPVSVEAMPEYVPQAVVAIEDRRFYTHGGFDPRGFARAVWGVLTGRNLGGGSTITQQLARNMFDENIGFERRYVRKLRELQVAFELERYYTKNQILEAYLNEIYMGAGPVYGFQQASRAYLGKNITEVNVAEAALLAAILNNPGTYNPLRRPENALRRRNLVLTSMASSGYISEAEAEYWKEWPLPEEDHSSDSVHGVAPYFEEWVRQTLDDRFGEELYTGGLRIYTTLDIDMQRAARESMDWGWHRIEELPHFAHPKYAEFDTVQAFEGGVTPYLQGMMIVLDPHTGAVRSMIGGRDYEQSKFDRARLARRQAGSSFKPFVYASAIASGIPASHIIEDQPVVYPQLTGDDWRPRNFSEEFSGPITLREALRRSINMVAIKLGWEEVGIETVAQTARRMGIRTEIERFPSTTIGAAEVSPIQMAEAYSGFATLGTSVRPYGIVRVESAEGEVLWEPQPERTQVLDSLTARIMVDLLQDAANNGTGVNHHTVGGLPWGEVATAGKTGTTNDGTDTWFMGFTPNLQVALWFGMDRPIPMVDIEEPPHTQGTGGAFAAPVFGRFLNHVYYGKDQELDEESGVVSSPAMEPMLAIPAEWPMLPQLTTREVDSRSGKLWSRWCSEENRYTELYVPGTEPTDVCDDSGGRFIRIPRR